MECSICLLVPEGLITTTYCGHTFCSTCLDNWLNFGNSCPFCRALLLPITEEPDFENDSEESDESEHDWEINEERVEERQMYSREFVIVPTIPGEIRWTRLHDFGVGNSYTIRYQGFVGDGLVFSARVSPEHPILGRAVRVQSINHAIQDFQVIQELTSMRSFVRGDVTLSPLAIHYMHIFDVTFELWDMDQEERLVYELI